MSWRTTQGSSAAASHARFRPGNRRPFNAATFAKTPVKLNETACARLARRCRNTSHIACLLLDFGKNMLPVLIWLPKNCGLYSSAIAMKNWHRHRTPVRLT